MHALVPNDKVTLQTKQILTRAQPFEMFYTLNCQNLCSDFQEDLEFRFSWGITAMIQRFTGKSKTTSKGAILNNHNSSSNVNECGKTIIVRCVRDEINILFCLGAEIVIADGK